MKRLKVTKNKGKLFFVLPLLIIAVGIVLIFGSDFAENNYILRKESFLNFYSSSGPFLLTGFVAGIYLSFAKLTGKEERNKKKKLLLVLLFVASIQFVTFLLFGANPYEPNIARRFLYLFIPSLYILLGLVVDLLFKDRRIEVIFFVISAIISSWIFLHKTYEPFISFSAQASLNDFTSEVKSSLPDDSILILGEMPTGIIDSNLLFNKKISIFNQRKYFSDMGLDDPERKNAEIELIQQLRTWDETYPLFLLTSSDQEINWLCEEFECELTKEGITMKWVDFSGKNGGMVMKREPIILQLNLYKLKLPQS
jgi:hypothetical protein